MTNTQSRTSWPTAVTALAAALTVVVTVFAFVVTTKSTNEDNRKQRESTDKANHNQQELTRQGQITDRYTAAVDQLGRDQLDVRLGGIYALERIMGESKPDQPTIVEILFAFVRTMHPFPAPVAQRAANTPRTMYKRH